MLIGLICTLHLVALVRFELDREFCDSDNFSLPPYKCLKCLFEKLEVKQAPRCFNRSVNYLLFTFLRITQFLNIKTFSPHTRDTEGGR